MIEKRDSKEHVAVSDIIYFKYSKGKRPAESPIEYGTFLRASQQE